MQAASRDFGSRGFTAAALFTLTLFRRGKIIHGATYFEDAGQRSPARDVATIVQYDTIASRQQSWRAANNRRTAARAVSVRPSWNGALSADKRNRET